MKEGYHVNIALLGLLGIVIGMLTILMGGGGGGIYLGILTGVVGLKTARAASTSLVTRPPPLMIGAWSYYRQKKIDVKIGNQMLITAIPSVIVGALVSGDIPAMIYKWLIGLILLALGFNMLFKKASKVKKTPQNDRLKANLCGVLAGLMVGVAGMSGGNVITAGLFLLGLKAFDATATSTYVLVFMSAVGMLFHIAGGSVDWQAGIPLMVGATVGALIAPRLAAYLMKTQFEYYMKPIIGVVLVLLGAKSLM